MTEKNIKNLKNLTITELRKKSKELNTQTEHKIDIKGDEFKIKVDDTFLKTKQLKVLDDLIDFFNEGNDNPEIMDLATPYTSLLMIKHFTSLEVPNDTNAALDLLEVLINLDVLANIIELMPEDETDKMYNLLSDTVNRINSNLTEMENNIREIAPQVENKEVKEMLENGGK